MKKILLVLICVFGVLMVKADNSIRFTELPIEAQAFVRQYFSDYQIDNVKRNMHKEKDFKVKFTDGSKVKFDRRGQWTKIKMMSGSIKNEVMPLAIRTYIIEKYPQQLMMQIDREGHRYDIQMSNGDELVFNRNGRLLRIDD